MFQSLKGLILTIYYFYDNNMTYMFQSLKGLILTKVHCGHLCKERVFQSLKGLILTMIQTLPIHHRLSCFNPLKVLF